MYKSISNFKFDDSCKSFNCEPSLTVPDQAISVRELLYRYTRGIAPTVSQNSVFDLSPDDLGDPDQYYDDTASPGFDVFEAVDLQQNLRRDLTFYDNERSGLSENVNDTTPARNVADEDRQCDAGDGPK